MFLVRTRFQNGFFCDFIALLQSCFSRFRLRIYSPRAGPGKNSGPASKTRYFVKRPFFITRPIRAYINKQTRIKMLRGFLCLFRIETMCKWLRFNSKKASNAVSNCQICKCSFSTKIGTGKLGRISKKTSLKLQIVREVVRPH